MTSPAGPDTPGSAEPYPTEGQVEFVGPFDRFDVVVEGRKVPFLANAIAIAMGYTCHPRPGGGADAKSTVPALNAPGGCQVVTVLRIALPEAVQVVVLDRIRVRTDGPHHATVDIAVVGTHLSTPPGKGADRVEGVALVHHRANLRHRPDLACSRGFGSGPDIGDVPVRVCRVDANDSVTGHQIPFLPRLEVIP